ncbi:MAG: amino acid ABC transporter permease [Treponema sp.]|jgi:L-cystine transport system permease protein|nr:amino acid ABC transporter permease [Treponema sp.]
MQFNFNYILEALIPVLRGLPVTLFVVSFSMAAAFPLGFFLALLVSKRKGAASGLGALFVSFMRGTPMIVQIYVVFFSLPGILAFLAGQLKLSINVYQINPLVYAVIVFTLNTCAVFCEIFRSALHTVGPAQMEAALSSGLTEAQGYWRVVIPQMMEAACAPLATASIELMKNSSLVFYMTVMDIMGIIKTTAAEGYNYLEGYTLAWIIYLVLCYGVEFIWFLAEKRLKSRRSRESVKNSGEREKKYA